MNKVISKTQNESLKKAAKMLDCIDVNWKLLSLIADNQGMNVTDIHVKMRMRQPDISIRLSKLREYGLVESVKIGRHVFYNITDRFCRVAEKLKNHAKTV